ncbi:hypothetical protein BH23ACT9_BH23ACT9_26410 [soil metagenome]
MRVRWQVSVPVRTLVAIGVVALLPACQVLEASRTAEPVLAPTIVTTPGGVSGDGAASGDTAADPQASTANSDSPATATPDPNTPTASPAAPADQASIEALPPGVSRPDWLGTRPLQVDADGQAIPEPTPADLVDRRIPTIDLLPPPAPDAPFAATIEPLSDEIVARSTWTPECPVSREQLRYLTVSFWGFDERPHTGEIIVNADWAQAIADIFGQLYDERYPIEEMRVVASAELEGIPTGDGNVTSGFVCRSVRGSTTWSQHAHGLAVDINPFLNPYLRGNRILPELAGAYLDRSHERPGMLYPGSTAVQAFDAIGWGWGGRWGSLIDWMHFSANGR